jgi:hypothetical protein
MGLAAVRAVETWAPVSGVFEDEHEQYYARNLEAGLDGIETYVWAGSLD